MDFDLTSDFYCFGQGVDSRAGIVSDVPGIVIDTGEPSDLSSLYPNLLLHWL